MTNKASYKFCPSNLDFDQFDVPPDLTKEHLISIISTIVTSYFNRVDGYTPLSSVIMKSQDKKYKRYLIFLETNGIIRVDHSYLQGRKNKGYMLSQKYRSAPLRIVEVKENRKFNSKHAAERTKELKPVSHLLKFFDDLDFDYESAMQFAKKEYEGKANPLSRFMFNPDKKRLESYNRALITCEKFKHKDFNPKPDKTTGRFFTPITLMNKKYRKFLSYKGDKLISIDITAMHPMLLIYLYNILNNINSLPSISSLPLSSSIKNNNLFPSSIYLSNLYSIYMLGLTPEIQQQKGFPEDYNLFKSKLEKGELYEYLAQEATERLGMKFTNRKAIKGEVFKILFSSYRFLHQKNERNPKWDARFKKMFSELFPSIYKVMDAVQRLNKPNLPTLLQSIEAKVMLSYISKEITLKWPAAPVFTVHDCVMTTAEYVENVKEVMEKHLYNLTSIVPQLSIERTKCGTSANTADTTDHLQTADQMDEVTMTNTATALDLQTVRCNFNIDKKAKRKRMAKGKEYYEKQLNELLNQPVLDGIQKRQIRKIKAKLSDPEYFDKKSGNMKRDKLRDKQEPGPIAYDVQVISDGDARTICDIKITKVSDGELTKVEYYEVDKIKAIPTHDEIMIYKLQKRYGLYDDYDLKKMYFLAKEKLEEIKKGLFKISDEILDDLDISINHRILIFEDLSGKIYECY